MRNDGQDLFYHRQHIVNVTGYEMSFTIEVNRFSIQGQGCSQDVEFHSIETAKALTLLRWLGCHEDLILQLQCMNEKDSPKHDGGISTIYQSPIEDNRPRPLTDHSVSLPILHSDINGSVCNELLLVKGEVKDNTEANEEHDCSEITPTVENHASKESQLVSPLSTVHNDVTLPPFKVEKDLHGDISDNVGNVLDISNNFEASPMEMPAKHSAVNRGEAQGSPSDEFIQVFVPGRGVFQVKNDQKSMPANLEVDALKINNHTQVTNHVFNQRVDEKCGMAGEKGNGINGELINVLIPGVGVFLVSRPPTNGTEGMTAQTTNEIVGSEVRQKMVKCDLVKEGMTPQTTNEIVGSEVRQKMVKCDLVKEGMTAQTTNEIIGSEVRQKSVKLDSVKDKIPKRSVPINIAPNLSQAVGQSSQERLVKPWQLVAASTRGRKSNKESLTEGRDRSNQGVVHSIKDIDMDRPLRRNGVGGYLCHVCTYNSKYPKDVRQHMRTHTGERPYKCPYCDIRCIQSQHLVLHVRTHTGEKPFKCTECDYRSVQVGQLQRHMYKHSGERPFKCSQCDFATVDKCSLSRHYRSHSLDKPYQCTICNARYLYSQNLKSHMAKHTGEKRYKCTFCTYATRYHQTLKNHLNKHNGTKPYKCPHCDFCTAYVSHFKRHKKTHTGERLLKCSFCPYTTIHHNALKVHKAGHTGRKLYGCDQCDYATNSGYMLKVHKMLHTGERPYQCSQCPFSCRTPAVLKNHVLTHTGRRPHECDVCGAHFLVKSALTRHRRTTHSDAKPFQCARCGICYKRKNHLQRHMATAHSQTLGNVQSKPTDQPSNCF